MQVFLALLVLVLIPFTTLTKAERISKKGCNDTCGGVSIPFPFGIGINCFLNEWFNVDCNSSTPYLSALNNMEVLVVELPLYVTLNFSMTFDCQNQVKNSTLLLSYQSPYFISGDYNSLFVEGCGIYADVSLDGDILAGCSTFCRNDTVIERNNCFGIGCCQAITDSPGFITGFNPLSINVRGLESPGGDGSCGSGSAFFMNREYFKRAGFPRPSLDGVNIYVPITLRFSSGNHDDISLPECESCRLKGGYCVVNLEAESGASCYIYKKSKLGVILGISNGIRDGIIP